MFKFFKIAKLQYQADVLRQRYYDFHATERVGSEFDRDLSKRIADFSEQEHCRLLLKLEQLGARVTVEMQLKPVKLGVVEIPLATLGLIIEELEQKGSGIQAAGLRSMIAEQGGDLNDNGIDFESKDRYNLAIVNTSA